MTQPIVWCCPICQRMFDVGCCPEHRAPERCKDDKRTYNQEDGVMHDECERCRQPHPALNGMTPWDYYASAPELGKHENPVNATYSCACDWLDAQEAHRVK